MYNDVIKQATVKMEKTKDVYRQELASLRAGRANPKILDRITVDYYGTQTPLNQMANIMSPEPRILTISVWDQKVIPLVEKALQMSDLGMNPSNDGKVIRLVVPELNEERRKELTKLVWKSAEDARVAIRSIRRDGMEQFKKLKKNSDITEDEQYKAEDEMQKVTDSAIKDIDEMAQEKEKEILSV